MKKILVLLFCVLALSLTASGQKRKSDPSKPTAQEQKVVSEIRQRYADIKNMINLMGEGPEWMYSDGAEDSPGGWPPEYFQVKIVQNLPATGYHEENVRMYYEEEETDEEEIYPPLRLAFASSKYNFAAREYYEEYLYDKKGNLIFIFAQEPDLETGTWQQMRFYMQGTKVVQTIVRECPLTDDFQVRDLSQDSASEVYSGSGLPTDYIEIVDTYVQKAHKIEKMFKVIDDGRTL